MNVINIGLLEDEEIIYLSWKLLEKNNKDRFKITWFKTFEACLDNLHFLDILVCDRMIEQNAIEYDLILDGYAEIIRNKFKKKIVISSYSSIPKKYMFLFDQVLANKVPKNLDEII